MTWRDELGIALGSDVTASTPIGGGDINDAYRVDLRDGRAVFAKVNADAPPAMFAAEAHGLDWLRAADSGLAIPRVLAHAGGWLALELLALGPSPDPAALGRGLAHLHRAGAPSFGLDAPSFLATLPQDNRTLPDAPTFYVERRLRPLATTARELGRAPDLDAALDRLRASPDRFGPPEPPARLHGDLWWGNVGRAGDRAAIFDPAVYGGPREVDLAMLALFGELPDSLVAAYCEVWPLADDWRSRLELWQLYPLLAHAVLFGGAYGARAARILC